MVFSCYFLELCSVQPVHLHMVPLPGVVIYEGSSSGIHIFKYRIKINIKEVLISLRIVGSSFLFKYW